MNVVFLLCVQLLSSNMVGAENDYIKLFISSIGGRIRAVIVKKSDLTDVLYNYVPSHHVLLHNGEIILKNFKIGKRFKNYDAMVSILEDNEEKTIGYW